MTENETPVTPIAENTPTQTLFRFVSLRSPQLSDEKEQDKRFILIPEDLKTDTHFYVPVTTGTGSKLSLLRERAGLYAQNSDCITDLNAFKNTYAIVYHFAAWLARNKGTCTYEEFIQQRDIVYASIGYTTPNLLVLWNNLIYQVVTQKDFYIKETVMQMLFAIHALQHQANNENEAKTLLEARVVLPKELMMDENSPSSSQASRIADVAQETFPTEEMKKQQEISLSKVMLGKYEELKKNLATAEKQYSKEYQTAYQLQQEAYQTEIAPIMAEYNEAVAAAKAEYCNVRPPEQEYDPNDPCRQPKEVPQPVLPKFEFNFRDEISGESLAATLKPGNLETALNILGFEFYTEFDPVKPTEADIAQINSLLEGRNTFAEINALISESVEKSNNTIVENTDGNNEVYTSIGGVILPMSKAGFEPYTYQLCPQKIGRYNTFSLSITVPDSSWDVAGINLVHKEYGSNNQIITSNFSYFTKSRSGDTIYLSDLLSSPTTTGVMLIDVTRDFEFDITFTNGQTTHFTVPGVTLKSCLSGYFETWAANNPGNPGEPVDPENTFIPSGFGFKNIGIADYLKVEQSTHAYVEGEVAHIENIMAREYREKSTRKLRRTENTTTTSSDTEREQLSDTTTANRFEMQTEIAKMMQEATDIGAYANTSYTSPKGTFSLNAGANYAHHQSKEESTRQAANQAQDITSRAMDRIVNKVHEERIEKIIEEFEENNSHGFDNRKGDKHVVSVYRWVDKLMKNQIYNYGKRMMFEFMIPEPAKLHLLGTALDKNANQASLIKPEDPRTSQNMPMKDYLALENDMVLRYWASKYNVEIDGKPEDYKVVGTAFATNQNSKEAGFTKSSVEKIQIPEGYYTTHSQINIGPESEFGAQNYLGQGWQAITVADNTQYNNVLGNPKVMPKYTEEVPVSYFSVAQHGQVSSVIIYLQVLPEYKKAWLRKTFNAIITAYEEALVEYNNKLSEEQNKAVQIKGSNPAFYRQIENIILRKNCISYMADRNANSTHGYGLEGLTIGTSFGDYETVLSSTLDKYTAFVKFMEQAFEWENLSYYLYPYYWGKKSNWSDLYQSDDVDPLFRSFLQSGMARVVVTVRPGFEDAVQFYLATGKIWNGGEVPVIGDELYLSIVDELKEPKGIKQGKAWLTRLPTTLNILQAESIGLKVAHALPFTTEDPDDFEVPSEVITEDKFNFEKNDHLLGIELPSSTAQAITGDWQPAVN
ncbi:hypothetical protein CHRYSEOSP005_02680 [Chryseobacterium sp. Alg-005]|uniref:hypothetical protein n=1 Tax=Chryseobacterium sp. Alg-005 TaxID=3159516 RepID=UPI0035559246